MADDEKTVTTFAIVARDGGYVLQIANDVFGIIEEPISSPEVGLQAIHTMKQRLNGPDFEWFQASKEIGHA